MTTKVDSVPLEVVVRTDELSRRSCRAPRHAVQSQALQTLAHALAEEPHRFARHLATTVLQALQVGSAGISLQVRDAKGTRFHWSALVGAWQAHSGSDMSGRSSFCADALAIGGPVLFVHPERRYGDMAAFTPPMAEGLLVPLVVEGVVTGALCAISHDEQRWFDAEDLRLLEALGHFAACAWRVVATLTRGSGKTDSRSARVAPTPVIQQSKETALAGCGRRVLVVDDNEDAAASMAALLELDQHVTHVAHTGPDAVDAAASFQPDVVLLDLDLPQMNGYEVARRIRAREGGSGVLLVAITGWGRKEDRDKTLAAGFDAHLVKPTDIEALASLLSRAGPARPPG